MTKTPQDDLHFAEKGVLVKLVNKMPGRIAERSEIKCYKITNIDYLHEILDKPNRFLSLRPNTIGRQSIKEVRIKCDQQLGLYLGSFFLDDYFRESVVLHVYRAILLGNVVYGVNKRCVYLAEQ